MIKSVLKGFSFKSYLEHYGNIVTIPLTCTKNREEESVQRVICSV